MAGDEGNGGGGIVGTENFAKTEPQYVPAKVSVWWDFENCQVPRGCEPHLIAKNISSALVTMNYTGPVTINAYGDTTNFGPSIQQALNSTGISLNHVPGGAKDASDKKILVDMLFWAIDNPAPANFLLISGDRDFSNALHQLSMRRYNILLAQPKKASNHLTAAAKNVWLWSILVTGGPPLTKNQLSHFIKSTTSISGTGSTQIIQSGDSSCESPPPGNQRRNKGGSFESQLPSNGPQDGFTVQNTAVFNNQLPSNKPQKGLTDTQLRRGGPKGFIINKKGKTVSKTMGSHKKSIVNKLKIGKIVSNTMGSENKSTVNKPKNGKAVSNTIGFDNKSTVNKPKKGKTVPNTIGSDNKSIVNKPKNGKAVSNTIGSDNKSTVNKPKNGETVLNTIGSDNKSTVNKPKNGKTVSNTIGFDNKSTVNKPKNGETMSNTVGSDNMSTVNKPKNGKTVSNITGSDTPSTLKESQKGNVSSSGSKTSTAKSTRSRRRQKRSL